MKANITKSKVWQIIGVAVLCAVCVLGSILGIVFGMNHSTEDLNVSKNMSSSPDGSFVMEAQAEQGISLLMSNASVSSDGSTSQTIVATAYDSNNVEASTTFNWSASWQDASSEFATGKDVSDYILLVPSEDTKSCEVIAKKMIGEVVIVKVFSLDNPNASATVTVNYVRRIFRIDSITINNVMDTIRFPGNTKFVLCPYGCEHSDDCKNTINSISCDYFDMCTIKRGTSIKLKKFFVSFSANELYTNKLLSTVPTLDIEKSKNIELDFVENSDGTYSFYCSIEDLFPDRTAEEYASISNVFLNNKGVRFFDYSLELDLIYNGNVIQTFDERNFVTGDFSGWFSAYFDRSKLTYSVESVSTDKSTLDL